MKMLSTIKSAIKWLWAEPTSYSKKLESNPPHSFPIKVRIGGYWVIFREEYRNSIVDPNPVLCYVIKDPDDLFKICEGKVYMVAAYDSIVASIIENPLIRELLNKTKQMNN
jgi:hypothetical protein